MEKDKTLRDYIDFNDTEQMFFALYPLMLRGDLNCESVAKLLGNNLDGWDIMELCWKYNLSTACQKETTIEEELESTKKFVIGYHE